MQKEVKDNYELIIIGTGPAGCSAALYAARAGINTLQISGMQLGGQLTSTSEVENYPGVKLISGIELMETMQNQVKVLDVDVLHDTVTALEKTDTGFLITTEGGLLYIGKSIIIATGANPKLLKVKGEEEFWGKGISTCATCDGFFCKAKRVMVVGGGNTAAEDALFLSNLAASVTLIHRRDSLRADKSLQDRVFRNRRVTVLWNTELVEVLANEENKRVGSVVLKNNLTQTNSTAKIDHIFIAIGYTPNSRLFKGLINCNEDGHIITSNTHTNIKGIFAAGDVTDVKYKQAIIAAGNGAFAAMEAQRYLENDCV